MVDHMGPGACAVWRAWYISLLHFLLFFLPIFLSKFIKNLKMCRFFSKFCDCLFLRIFWKLFVDTGCLWVNEKFLWRLFLESKYKWKKQLIFSGLLMGKYFEVSWAYFEQFLGNLKVISRLLRGLLREFKGYFWRSNQLMTNLSIHFYVMEFFSCFLWLKIFIFGFFMNKSIFLKL